MKKKSYLVIFCIFCICQYSYCQQDQAILDIPHTVPPSPTASSLGKYGEWPVSNYTGIPQIEIPLYTIKTSKLVVPVSLSYHASGVKVEEISSWVGAGWALNAGGVITRTPMGIEDEKPYGYTHTPARYKGSTMATNFDVTSNMTDLSFFNYAASGAYDTEPDVYYFNFPGGTGKLFLDENNQFRSATANTIKIIHDPITTTQSAISYWELVDGNGITYIFGSTLPDGSAQEYSTVFSETRGMQNLTGQIKNAWYLKSIISPDKLDVITFSYVNKLESYESIPKQYFRWPVGYVRHSDKESQPYGFSSTQVSPDRLSNRGYCILKEIQWSQGKLVLTANTSRNDNITGGLLLDKIDLYDKKANLLRTYSLLYDNNTNRPFLTQVNGSSATTGQEKYTFNYYPGLPGRNSNDQDHWGYYNNAGNTNLVPATPLTLNTSLYAYDYSGAAKPSANREPNSSFTMAGSLKSIAYPTGGKTEFEYETNNYTKIGPDALNPLGQDFQSNQYGGGLRIKSIKNYDWDGNMKQEKDYKYEFPLSTGLLFNKPIYSNVSFQIYSSCCYSGDCWNHFVDVVNTAPRSQVILGTNQGSPVGYSQVEESINQGNGGKTIYYYRNDPDIFNDINFDRAHFGIYNRPAFLQSTSNDYKNGQLLTKEVYNYTTKFNLVKKIVNTYDNNDNPGDPNFYQLPVLKIKSTGDSTITCTGYYMDANISYRKLLFAYGIYYLKSVWPQLKTTTITNYDDNGNSSVETTNFFYSNPQHLQTTRISKTNSKGELIDQQISYPHEMVSLGLDLTGIYQNMVSKNMVMPIRTQKFKNTTNLLQTFKTNYKDWGNNIIKPETIESSVLNNTNEVRLRYEAYDNKGNLLTVSKEKNVKHNYLWGYNNSYPVAEVIGSDYTTISGMINQSTLDNPLNDQELRDEINKIRTGLASTKALVTTFTYNPLLGISSQTDAKGKTQYYNYDGFGRLVLIRDDNNNILKTYCYNYQGQTGNCNMYLQSVEKSGIFIRSCGPEYSGSAVTYTVPVGTYYSTLSVADANAKAQADVDANGQNYANDKGTCTAITYVTIKGYNSKSTSYKIKLVDNSTSVIYYFDLPTGTSVAQTLGTVPSGTYTVSFLPNPSPVPSATFNINGYTYTGGSTATFNNISITATSTASMY